MKIKNDIWFWECYFFLLFLFLAKKTYSFFMPFEPCNLYFSILNAFDSTFFFSYYYNLMHLMLSWIHLIPFFLFVYRKDWLEAQIWQYLYIFHIIFTITGNSYQTMTIAGTYHQSPGLAAAVFFQSIAIYIPFYVICYQYAFMKDKVLMRK